ncbi:MAG: chemotaxis protein CheW [Akkermansiaceae bacterium]|nr:chemotaxis protein CheW [Akkermansiaceae bacterium]
MPKARYLAPWHQEDLWERLAEGEGEELTVEALRELKGKPAIYHCISRVVDRQFFFGDVEKEQFVRYMRIYERFCQVRVLAFCVMSNHFHILLEVPARPEDRGKSWSDARFLEHLRCLYSGAKLREIEWKLEQFRSQGNTRGAEELRESIFRRMWDLSQFMKTLKQRFARWFNKHHGRKGTLWEERFKSTLVESGLAARTVAGYIDLNPVRAGIVSEAEDYRWCSFAEAVAGKKRAREGLQRVMYERELHATNEERSAEMLLNWRNVARRYRQLLKADQGGGEVAAETAMQKTKPLSEAEMLHKKVRYFADGLAIGTKRFLNGLFAATRDYFGPRRRSGARKIRHVKTALCSLRDLADAAPGRR